MLDALAEFDKDGNAIGTGAKAIPQDTCSYQAVVPKEIDWRTYAARYVSKRNPELADQPAALATDYQVKQ